MVDRKDVANRWIRVDFWADLSSPEETTDVLVKMMSHYASRVQIRVGIDVQLTHVEMSESLFREIGKLHDIFPAFRMTSYKAKRKAMGVLCGVTVYRNDALPHCVQFQYKDARVALSEHLLDPVFINHPKSAGPIFIYA